MVWSSLGHQHVRPQELGELAGDRGDDQILGSLRAARRRKRPHGRNCADHARAATVGSSPAGARAGRPRRLGGASRPRATPPTPPAERAGARASLGDVAPPGRAAAGVLAWHQAVIRGCRPRPDGGCRHWVRRSSGPVNPLPSGHVRASRSSGRPAVWR
jgi:hypothetical protein